MAGLFLPFTPRGKATELLAIEVKKRLGLLPGACVDPDQVLPLVPARLVEPQLFHDAAPEVAECLFVRCADRWSGIGLGESPHDGASLILLNPTHAPTRRRATLMEEIVHIVLQHPKSRLTFDGEGGVAVRSFDSQVEGEAFEVGAACLLPYGDIFRCVKTLQQSMLEIAGARNVSEEYVRFRINTAGLSRVYRSSRAVSA